MSDIPKSVVVTLDKSLQRGEQTIGMIHLRKPEGGALRGVSLLDLIQMNTDAVKKVLPRISDPILTAADCEALDPADLFECAAEIAGFLLKKGQRADFQQA